MSKLMVRETFINETKGAQFGESDWYEAYTDNRGKLFRDYQREYGRCISAMYRDVPGKPPITVGWVFSRRERYEDARGNNPERDFYVREVWVEVQEVLDSADVEYAPYRELEEVI